MAEFGCGPANLPGRRLILALGCLLPLLAAFSRADAGGLQYSGWGVRCGFSSRPGQLVLGSHLDLGELAPNVRLVPNADIGFGGHLTVFTLNGDLVGQLPVSEGEALYFGGSLALIASSRDLSTLPGRPPEGSGTNLGVAGVMGYSGTAGNRVLFLDLKVGITDQYPDLKLMVGTTFLP